MYLGLVGAFLLTLVTGFLAGKEYDNMRRRYYANQRRRREEIARKQKAIRARRQMEEDQAKFDFMYNIQWDAPTGKGVY